MLVETMHRDLVIVNFLRGAKPSQRMADGTLVVEEPVFDPIAGRVNPCWYCWGPSGKIEIEQDILAAFGDLPLAQVDKVMLQTHLNDLARKLSSGRVQHARFYMKAIFEQAIDQDFVQRNPARKLILPKELLPVDKTTLTWNQVRLVLASVTLRDRILVTLDMNETFRPSELFALRWSGFNMDQRTLWVTQTAFRASCAITARPGSRCGPCTCRKAWPTICGCGSRSAPMLRRMPSSFPIRANAMGRRRTASSAPTTTGLGC